MKTEIKIILDKEKKGSETFEKGNCFENLIRDILATQRYEISSNINFTGMEIDLLAKHKDRRNEILYVECKAKEKIDSKDIRNFVFNVEFKEAKYGYFLSTKEYDHQAGGLIEEIESKEKYSNITFFRPCQILSILQENRIIKIIQTSNIKEQITKQFLAVTYFGDFYVFVVKQKLALPTHIYIFDAKKGNAINDN